MSNDSELALRVAKLERTVAFLLRKLDVEYKDNPEEYAPPEVLDLVRQGKLIEAIKVYREMTGVDLTTAKQFVDSLR